MGADRRGLITGGSLGRGTFASVVVAGAALVLGGLAVASTLTSPIDPARSVTLAAQLRTAGVAVAAIAAILCLVRWRVVGEAAAIYLGTASLVYATAVLLPKLTALVGGSGPGAVPAGGRLTTACLVVLALAASQVDTRVRPRWVFPGAAVVVVVVTAALQRLSTSRAAMLPSGEAGAIPFADPSTAHLVALLWLGLGLAAGVIGARRRQPLMVWFAGGLLLLSAAKTVGLLLPTGEAVTSLAVACLQLGGVLTIAVGAGTEVVRAFRSQDGRALASVAQVREVRAQAEAEVAVREERAHEARNVLLGIEAATATLEQFRDQLEPEGRQELSEAISRGVERLQRLVDTSPALEPVTRFHPAEVLAPLATAMRSQGVEIHVDVPSHLITSGRPLATAQVLHNVLENARRYGQGRVWVRGTLDGDRVIISVTDAGTGVGDHEREAIFTRGTRGAAADGTEGSGLGLHIARTLMHDQEGDLRLAPPTGGGATFELLLPGASTLLGEEPLDQGDELAESAGARQLLHLVLGTTTPTHPPAAIDDHDGRGGVSAG